MTLSSSSSVGTADSTTSGSENRVNAPPPPPVSKHRMSDLWMPRALGSTVPTGPTAPLFHIPTAALSSSMTSTSGGHSAYAQNKASPGISDFTNSMTATTGMPLLDVSRHRRRPRPSFISPPNSPITPPEILNGVQISQNEMEDETTRGDPKNKEGKTSFHAPSRQSTVPVSSEAKAENTPNEMAELEEEEEDEAFNMAIRELDLPRLQPIPTTTRVEQDEATRPAHEDHLALVYAPRSSNPPSPTTLTTASSVKRAEKRRHHRAAKTSASSTTSSKRSASDHGTTRHRKKQSSDMSIPALRAQLTSLHHQLEQEMTQVQSMLTEADERRDAALREEVQGVTSLATAVLESVEQMLSSG